MTTPNQFKGQLQTMQTKKYFEKRFQINLKSLNPRLIHRIQTNKNKFPLRNKDYVFKTLDTNITLPPVK